MTNDMKGGLYQPRWRRMKEKPPARHPVAPRKSPAARVQADEAWPAVVRPHRIDHQARGA